MKTSNWFYSVGSALLITLTVLAWPQFNATAQAETSSSVASTGHSIGQKISHKHRHKNKKARPVLPPLPLLKPTPAPEPQPKRIFNGSLTAFTSTVAETDASPFTTASGAHVADGIVAANCLAFGTKIKIPALFGDKIFVVEDRLAKWHGCNSVDLWFPNRPAAFQFGHRYAEVQVF